MKSLRKKGVSTEDNEQKVSILAKLIVKEI